MTRRLALFLFCILALVGCGDSNKPDPKTPANDTGMDDAFALLPGSPIAVGTVDARAFFSSKTFGAELGKIVEKYVPLTAETGFQASRDVDRVTFGSYSYSGIDVVAVVIGRFDAQKIKDAVSKQVPAKGGGTLVASQYAGRDLFTVNNVGFTVLSSTKALAGSESGMRRVLERIKDGRVKRDIPKWMLDTMETPGSSASVAIDLASQPMPAEAARQIPVPFIQTSKQIRVLWSFKDPGVQLAGSFSYADAAAASAAADQVKQALNMSKLLAFIGIKLQNVDVKVEQQDVQVKLEVDDASLRQLIVTAPQYLGGGQ